jgi:hypothetical protein
VIDAHRAEIAHDIPGVFIEGDEKGGFVARQAADEVPASIDLPVRSCR